MKTDNKGMTLIEVVVSLLILSTASLIMVMGFTTAINIFTDANAYKNAINKEESVLQGDTTYKQEVSTADQDVKYSITVNSGDTPIEVKGTLTKATTSLENASLSSIEVGSINTNDTKKARNIYKNYCNIMKELGEYLKNHGVSENEQINSSICKETIVNWINEKTGKNVDKFEIMKNMPKLYSLIYPDIELGTLPSKIKEINNKFPENDYKYVTLCMYRDSDISNIKVGDFFDEKNGSCFYKDNIYILIGKEDHANGGDRPNKIWALYDNNSLDSDTDVWLIPSQSVSTDVIKNKSYKIFYTEINNQWFRYTTTKQ